MTNFIVKYRRLRISKKLIVATAVATAALLLMPTPAAALFGLGDIVFDPTSYATLAKIWSSNASTLTKVTEEVAQLGKIYANGVQTYKQALAMAERVNQFTRLNWLTVGITAVNDATANRFGEATNWAALVNGDPALASSVWKSATLAMSANSSSFLSGLFC